MIYFDIISSFMVSNNDDAESVSSFYREIVAEPKRWACIRNTDPAASNSTQIHPPTSLFPNEHFLVATLQFSLRPERLKTAVDALSPQGAR